MVRFIVRAYQHSELDESKFCEYPPACMQSGPFGLSSAQVRRLRLCHRDRPGSSEVAQVEADERPDRRAAQRQSRVLKNNLSGGLAQPEAKKVVAKCLGLSAAAMYGRSRLARHQRLACCPMHYHGMRAFQIVGWNCQKCKPHHLPVG